MANYITTDSLKNKQLIPDRYFFYTFMSFTKWSQQLKKKK